MPVHWMYNLEHLKKDYGEITGYTRPLDKFEGTYMSLSNTDGSSDMSGIVGKVILHGKEQYWGRGANYHYHCGLKAGENTLEPQLARLVTRQITESGEFNADLFR